MRVCAARLAGTRPRRGACEAVCAAGAATAATASTWPGAAGLALLIWWCVCAGCVDVLVRRLPNVLTLGGGAVIVTAAVAAGHGRAAVAGAVLLAAPLLVVHLVSPRSLGGGDVKLAIGLGAAAGVAGAPAWLLTALLPPLPTAVAALIVLARSRRAAPRGPRAVVVPHGPSMCAATVLALLVTG